MSSGNVVGCEHIEQRRVLLGTEDVGVAASSRR
jgi:hypothetical protein